MARTDWKHETVVEYDTALLLAGKIAELEGEVEGSQAWSMRLAAIYTEARDGIAAGYVEADDKLAGIEAQTA